MKFIIEKKELSTLTTLVHRAASSKNTIPVLSGLLIEASQDKGLIMTATDMEIGIKATSNQVEVADSGTVLVNAHYFADFIKLLPDLPIILELKPDTAKLAIQYGRSSGSINTYRDFEYPDLPLANMERKLSLPQQVLKEALRKTSFAVSQTHFRQVFTGILFDIAGSELRVVASDTHRLAYFKYDLTEAMQPFSFIIPIRTVNELLRLLEDSAELVHIAITDNNVLFYRDEIVLLSRLIEGQYPNYEQVIPPNFTTKISISSQVLLNTLERAKTMPTDDKLKIQHVQMEFSEKEAVINSFSEAMGEIKEVIEEITAEGETSLKIAFNTSYLLDITKLLNAESEKIDINLSGSLGPAMIKNPEKENYIYILVPLRTSS
jgi:DNA polymerase-3 subunit beta